MLRSRKSKISSLERAFTRLFMISLYLGLFLHSSAAAAVDQDNVHNKDDHYEILTVPSTISDADMQNRLKSYTNRGCWMDAQLASTYGKERYLMLCHRT